MIQSMTGYGKAIVELPDKKINVEIKSLNSKAMDLSARIAPAYREKEMEIRNEIARVLERGKVDFSLWVEKKDAEQLATPINQELVAAYYHRIKEISSATDTRNPFPSKYSVIFCTASGVRALAGSIRQTRSPARSGRG